MLLTYLHLLSTHILSKFQIMTIQLCSVSSVVPNVSFSSSPLRIAPWSLASPYSLCNACSRHRYMRRYFYFIVWLSSGNRFVIHSLIFYFATNSRQEIICVNVSLPPRDVAVNCALLVYCAASSGNFFSDVSGQPIGAILMFLHFGFFNP